MKHYNFIKSLVRDFYEHLRDILPYDQAIDRAVHTIIDPIELSSITHPSIVLNTKEQLKDLLISELQYEVNIADGVDAGAFHTLVDNDGHIPWYREKVANEAIEFRFWKRYRKYLSNIKGWGDATINKLDEVTDEILEKLEDPTVRNRSFDRRGLVVGYVQSGKTANFMGLINKAIDSGYRIVIVLSGLHNNLRSQTQMRIDEEIIGRDTSDSAQIRRIGVATLPGEGYVNIDTFTTRNDNGDFNINFARQVGVQPGADRPMMFVVKKNSSVLRNLIRYFKECTATLSGEYTIRDESERTILNNLPLLLIDDEADQASPNTRAPENGDGELDPTTINKYIRELLNLFNQKAYVGYTATPFANIFIHHNIEHSEYGKDLFPSAFIVSMEAPSNYFGPAQVFGLDGHPEAEGLPIHIPVLDASQENSEFLPLRHRSEAVPVAIPESMKEAIKSFILSSAVRRLRGHGNKHNTMLIHCTRFNAIQNAIGRYVEEYFNEIRQGVINDDERVYTDLYTLWARDYNVISGLMQFEMHEWEDVKVNIKPAMLKMERRPQIINGSAGDILDYKSKESIGLSVIAIGGDKLSRGLTLEGLTVSYFTRASSLYDTLMQMGRWFGYRNGFEDLCRIYTTNDLFSWYRHISTAFEILRQEFLDMSRQKSTPKEFGLRVLSHPEMMVTNAMKMRHTETLPLTYRGKLTETITFSSNATIVNDNFSITEVLLASLPTPLSGNASNYLWKNIPKSLIVNFLNEYHTYKGVPAASSKRMVEFIMHQGGNSALEYWNVALMSLRRNKSPQYEIAGYEVEPLSRGLKEDQSGEKLYIGKLTGSEDEKIDYDYETEAVRGELRALFPRKERPLLMIYPLIIKDRSNTPLALEKLVIGIAISWPNNASLGEITYDINSVYRELELAEYD